MQLLEDLVHHLVILLVDLVLLAERHMADGEIISDSAAEEASESVASAEAEKAVPEMQRRRSRKRSTAEESMSEETASIRENVSELSSETVSTERPRGLGGSHRPRHVSRRKGGDVR